MKPIIADLTLTQWLLAFLAVAAGAAVQGAVGIGIGLISVPLLSLIDPRFVPGPALCSSLALTTLMVLRERRAMDLFGVKWGIAGRIAGTGRAMWALMGLPSTDTTLLIGGLVLLGVGFSISGWRIKRTTAALLGVGVLSGIMGTLSSVGGPPMALVYQNAPGPQVRATLSGFFIAGTLISLGGLTVVGRFGLSEIYLSAAVVPAVITGFWLSRRMTGLLDRGYIRPGLLALSATSALLVMAQALWR